MNEGLFEKYSKVLQKKKTEKEEVLQLIQEITGILCKEEEVEVNKKVIIFHITSVKKTIFLQRNIKFLLEEKGYSSKL